MQLPYQKTKKVQFCQSLAVSRAYLCKGLNETERFCWRVAFRAWQTEFSHQKSCSSQLWTRRRFLKTKDLDQFWYDSWPGHVLATIEGTRLTHFSNQVHVAQFKGTFTMFRFDQCQIWLNNENGNDRDQMGIACTSVTSCWRSKLLA